MDLEKVVKIIGCVVLAIAYIAIPVLTGISWVMDFISLWGIVRVFGTVLSIGCVLIKTIDYYFETE